MVLAIRRWLVSERLALDRAAVEMSKKLEENRCLCTAIRPPTVPVGTSRLRITFTAAHELQDVDDLLDALSLARGMYR